MKRICTVLMLLIALSALPPPSNAALHPKDDPVFGPASITYDDTTGLEWLQLSATDWRSYNDITSQFGPGGEFEGWRHASLLEANELAIHAGITINVGETTANFTPTQRLIQLINKAAGTYAYGFVSNPAPNEPGMRQVMGIGLRDGNKGYAGLAFYMPDDYAEFGLAHMLVRSVPRPNVTFKFEGRLATGQRLEISYAFDPNVAGQYNGAGHVYLQSIKSATVKVDGATVPATLAANMSQIYIQNDLQADQKYDRYQAILEFSPRVVSNGLEFDRIFIYGEDPTSTTFSTVLNDENLVLDPGVLFGFPILKAIFQSNFNSASPTIAPVVSEYDEAVSGDLPSSLPLHTFDLGVGVNKISGSEFVTLTGAFDVESMNFNVPAGTQLESIEYDFHYSVEPGASSLQRSLDIWNGTFTQRLTGKTVVMLFTQNPSIEDHSPVDLFSSVMPLASGNYTLGGGGGVGTEGGWTGARSWNYTLRFVVRRIAPTDTTPPVIQPTVISEYTPFNGWYRGDVAIYWTVTDPESMVLNQVGCKAIEATSDTSGTTSTCTATSAGGTMSQSFTLQRDHVRPIVDAQFGPLQNVYGWNNTDVTVSFVGTDPVPGSGIASCSPSRVLSSEGANLAAGGNCTDVAGNSGSAFVSGIRIDKTPPSVSLDTPLTGASYAQGTSFPADYNCADALAGILTCAAPAASGEPFDTSTTGPKTFTVTGTDRAGNITTVTHSYTVTPASTPVYSLSASALAFGVQGSGIRSDAQSVVVINTGNVALPITNITRSGTNANQFSQTNDCGTSLAAGASCTVDVVFLPTSAGAKSASLNIVGGGGSGTKSVSLSGTGAVASYTLDPPALAFGSQARSVPSAPVAVTVTNTAPVDMPLTSVTKTGTNANQFSQTNNCGTLLPAGSDCTILVTFLPTSVGDKIASLNVNAGGGAGTKVVALSGTGIIPMFTLAPAALAFGNQTTTVASAAQSVTLNNTGSLALSITNLALSGGQANQFSQSHNCAASVPAGSSCAINVVFLPTSAGSKSTTLTVNAAGGAATQTVVVTGTGVVPAYSIDQTTLAFGNQPRNIASAAQTITLTNPGPAALVISGISRTGTNANQFSQTNNCGTSVAPGGTCAINVVFLPTSVGDKVAILNVNAGGGAGTKSVNLSGTGIVPLYMLAPASLDFGSHLRNTSSAPQIVTLSNTGEIPLPITSLALSGGNANQFSQTNDCGMSLAVGASCSINVTFRPTAAGARTTNLRAVFGGGAATPALVPLTGTGT